MVPHRWLKIQLKWSKGLYFFIFNFIFSRTEELIASLDQTHNVKKIQVLVTQILFSFDLSWFQCMKHSAIWEDFTRKKNSLIVFLVLCLKVRITQACSFQHTILEIRHSCYPDIQLIQQSQTFINHSKKVIELREEQRELICYEVYHQLPQRKLA